jgi:membrane-associated phospholipid phosphatase
MNLKKENILSHLFFKLFLLYWVLAVVLLFFSTRGEVLLGLNSISNPFFNKLFLYTTWMGHGTFGFLLILLLFFFNRIKSGLQMGMTLILVSIFTNFAKRVLFFQHNRPMWVYDYADLHYVISEVPLNYMRSFPSGHAMVAFGIAATFSLMFRSKWIHYSMFLYALLISFSRVYLCQHFFVDVLWGGILGCIAAVVSARIIARIQKNDARGIMDKSILRYLSTINERKLNHEGGI